MVRLILTVCATSLVLAGAAWAGAPLPPPKNGEIYVVAHRGAHVGVPENTLAAYERAITLGCDFVEIDVRTTKDGKLVSMHNDTVDAYTEDATGRVKDMTLSELKALDIGSRVGPEWADERIPTYEEILDLCKGRIGIYLDVKAAKVEDLLPPIQARAMEDQVLWLGGPPFLKRVAEQCGKCIPMLNPSTEDRLPSMLKRTNPPVVAPVWSQFSATFAKSCHEVGAIVIVDEEDESSWPDALAWGADGVQTDDPVGFIAWLKENGKSE